MGDYFAKALAAMMLAYLVAGAVITLFVIYGCPLIWHGIKLLAHMVPA